MYREYINYDQLKNYSSSDWERRHEKFEFTIWDHVKSGFSKKTNVPLNTRFCKNTCFNRGNNSDDAFLEKGSVGITIRYELIQPSGGLYGSYYQRQNNTTWLEIFFIFSVLTFFLFLLIFVGVVFLNNEQGELM